MKTLLHVNYLEIPGQLDKTFAQLTMEEKNAISHRGVANKKATDIIRQLQQETAGEINGTV